MLHGHALGTAVMISFIRLTRPLVHLHIVCGIQHRAAWLSLAQGISFVTEMDFCCTGQEMVCVVSKEYQG